MNVVATLMLSVLSLWDLSARQNRHERLRAELVSAIRAADGARMLKAAEAGVGLLPDSPAWRYNLACAASLGGDSERALRELGRAIDLGFRDAATIARDSDFAALSNDVRFVELVRRAGEKAEPPSASAARRVPARPQKGVVVLDEPNLEWDFDLALYRARIDFGEAQAGSASGNAGDLYVNLDRGHSPLAAADFPGVTSVAFSPACRAHNLDVDFPSVLLPCPAFGNASRAFGGPNWRSLPRAMMTAFAREMPRQCRLYLANQIYVFPAHEDFPPVGSRGDVFASIAPYWLVTAGRSWSDQPYLRAALEASRSLPPETKRAAVARGLLAPTVMTLIRKSLKAVPDEAAYLGAAAHPTALPADGLDVARLKSACAALAPGAIAPVVPVRVAGVKPADVPSVTEVTYSTPYASAWILRAADTNRLFFVEARDAADYAFVLLRDGGGAARLTRKGARVAQLAIDRTRLAATNRVDLAVFGRNAGTGWGAPSYVSFAVLDPVAPYCDPCLRGPRVASGISESEQKGKNER